MEKAVTDKLSIEECDKGASENTFSPWARDLYRQLADTMRENERLRECLQSMATYFEGDKDLDAQSRINWAKGLLEPHKHSEQPNCSGVRHAETYTGGISPTKPTD